MHAEAGRSVEPTSPTDGRVLGADEAKTRLAALLDEVEAGSCVTITKHGRPVARLVSAVPRPCPTSAVLDDLRSIRSGVRLGDVTVREPIDEGRS